MRCLLAADEHNSTKEDGLSVGSRPLLVLQRLLYVCREAANAVKVCLWADAFLYTSCLSKPLPIAQHCTGAIVVSVEFGLSARFVLVACRKP